jgi:hypothetical protein
LTNAPPQRNLDPIELAFNTILEPPKFVLDESTVTALAAALAIESVDAADMLNSNKRLPLARSQTRQEAEMIAGLVRECGLIAYVVADQELDVEHELPRARRIVMTGGELCVHYSGGNFVVAGSSIRLVVLGSLRQNRIDYSEGLTGVRTQSANVLDTAEFHSDEILLDVYTDSLEQSFRLRADGFDYSGLVTPLAFRSELNFAAAVRAIRKAAAQAVFDEDFARVRRLFSRAWPERTRHEARGLKRTGLTYRPVALSTLTSNNHDQFERYSRLMFLSVVKNLSFRAQ